MKKLLLTSLFIFAFPFFTHAAVVLDNNFPLTDPQNATSYGLNGAVISVVSSTTFPVVTSTTTLRGFRAYVVGSSPSIQLRLQLNDQTAGAYPVSLRDCSSPDVTGSAYGVSETAKLVEFTFSGSQCTLSPNKSYDLRLYYGSGSGYALKGQNGSPSFQASDFDGFTTSSTTLSFTEGIHFNYNTRFLSQTITSTSSNNFAIAVSYYLDPTEINRSLSQYNPTQIKFSLAQRNSTNQSSYSFDIPTTTGTSTRYFVLQNSNLANGVTYDILTSFSNTGVAFGSPQPFPGSYVYTWFSTGSVFGELTTTGQVENYNTLAVADFTPRECSLSDIGGCLINAVMYLLVPDSAQLQATLNSLRTSSVPFVASAYTSYSQVTTFSNTTAATSSNALDFHLKVPQAQNLDVSLFSVDKLYSLMSPTTRDIFRGLARFALWFGFLQMVLQSVNRVVLVSTGDNHRYR